VAVRLQTMPFPGKLVLRRLTPSIPLWARTAAGRCPVSGFTGGCAVWEGTADGHHRRLPPAPRGLALPRTVPLVLAYNEVFTADRSLPVPGFCLMLGWITTENTGSKPNELAEVSIAAL
jgi:hypothetical protein